MAGSHYLFILLFVLSLSACTPSIPQKMYRGPQLEPSQESTITTKSLTGDPMPGLGISSVDGEMTITILKRWFTGSPAEVKVLPGKHDFRLIYNTGYSIRTADLWVVACPGKTYVAKVRQVDVGTEIRMWIEEEESGNRVGGIKGSPDEPKGKNVSCDRTKNE